MRLTTAVRYFTSKSAFVITLGLAIFTLSACDSANTEYTYPERTTDSGDRDPSGRKTQDAEAGIFGKDGIDIFGQHSKNGGQGSGVGLGINSFLWRASLDTISFMPIASADPFGGVIITDWYTPAETPNERFKLNVFIMGRALRADGIKVSAFRQVRDQVGAWVDTPVDVNVVTDLENAVLTRARKMRISAQAVAEQGTR